MDSQFEEERYNPEHCGDNTFSWQEKKIGMVVSHLPAKPWPPLSWALGFYMEFSGSL